MIRGVSVSTCTHLLFIARRIMRWRKLSLYIHGVGISDKTFPVWSNFMCIKSVSRQWHNEFG
jgi:hypothetical protein